MKGFTRSLKNKVLFIILGYDFMLKFLDFYTYNIAFFPVDWIWFFSLIFLIFIHSHKAYFGLKKEVAEACLFLLYGAVVGDRIALALAYPDALISAEWIWTWVAFAGIWVHYWPLEGDPYSWKKKAVKTTVSEETNV